MKTFKIFLAVLSAVVFSATSFAQSHDHSKMGMTQDQTNMNLPQPSAKTESLKVWGACGMCKTRIENAVKTEGATAANWDEKTKLLTVTFDPKKTNIDALGKKLASVGHDTEKFKAPDDVYSKLPDCCHYERGK